MQLLLFRRVQGVEPHMLQVPCENAFSQSFFLEIALQHEGLCIYSRKVVLPL